MKTLHKPTLTLASLMLAIAASSALAQTPAPGAPAKPATKPATKPAGKPAAKPATAATPKTLGGTATGGAKLMTRDELRSCLKRLDVLNQGTNELDAQRAPLDRERDELKAAGEALKTERTELDRQLVPIREWEAKVRLQTSDIEAFNKRNESFAETPRNQQEKLAQELKAERERLEKVREALAADEAKLIAPYRAAIAAHNTRVTARDAKVVDWNARNAAAVDASAKQQDARTLWLGECANRPYLEDDEKAIKAGK